MILPVKPVKNTFFNLANKHKNIFYIIIFLLFANTGFAQENDKNFIVDLAPQLSFSTGPLKKTNSFGYGGSLGFQFVTTEKLRLVARFAAIGYRGKSYTDVSGYDDEYPFLDLLQVTAGVKYFFTYGLFGAVQAGPVFSLGEANRGTGVTYAPVLGFEFGEGPFYDISLRYDSNTIKGSTLNALTISVTYQF